MKKAIYLIFVLAFALFSNAFGQKPSMELTFTANNNGQPVALDSILIQNLTQGGDTTLYAPNNVLVLNYTLGISDNDGAGKNTFTLSQNYPNPFEEETTIQLSLPEKDHLKFRVYNLIGQQIAFYEKTLSEGKHSFTFYPGKEKYYLLTVTGNNATNSIKMVRLNSRGDGKCRIAFTGNENNPINLKSSQDINNFGFNLGDVLKFVGYTATGIAMFTNSPTGNKSYEFQIEPGIPCQGTPNVNYEGQIYQTVQIGTQCWFKENLNVGTMIMGSQEMTDNNITEKYCYNNDPANCSTYGGLYQWDEMMQYTTQQGAQGICPPTGGWHIPTDAEWTVLTDFLGGASIAGGEMKATGTIDSGTGLWYTPNEGATNSSGFTALPGGYRYYDGSFSNLSYYAFFWSSAEGTTNHAWDRYLGCHNFSVVRDNDDETYGFSVRCVQGESGTTIPTVTTSGITNITQTTANSGGNVTSDGGAIVTDRGICWSTSQSPTIADNFTWDGNGIGIFESNLIGLTPNTTYFIRAFATNSSGTAYGSEFSFNTEGININPIIFNPNLTYGTVSDIDGNVYKTILIGTQTWMAENLKTTKYRNGDPIPNATLESTWDTLTTGAFCWYNNDSATYKAIYGALYNWYSVSDSRNIAPTGWHVPTNEEWTTLLNYLGGDWYAGSALKEEGTSHWELDWMNDPGTNSSGFTALPGGWRIGGFGIMGENGYWWTISENAPEYAWYRIMFNDADIVLNYPTSKFSGFSVRCVMD